MPLCAEDWSPSKLQPPLNSKEPLQAACPLQVDCIAAEHQCAALNAPASCSSHQQLQAAAARTPWTHCLRPDDGVPSSCCSRVQLPCLHVLKGQPAAAAIKSLLAAAA
jgi:hypothetical protein